MLSFYDMSIPVIDRALANLAHVLRKGEADAEARKIAPETFLTARLYPDMFTLVGQVQVATALAKAFPYRVTGKEPPVYDDTEKTFADLHARIDKARGDLAKFDAAAIDGRERHDFTVKMGPRGDVPFTGISYLTGFILPNIYFHTTTAYNILRHNGVPLGKTDFFGG